MIRSPTASTIQDVQVEPLGRLPLLSPPGSKPVLVLDMDETLMHAHDRPHHPSAHSGAGSFTVLIDDPRMPAGGPLTKHVYLRPFVHEFLATVAQDWRVVVFTAGTRQYAKQVLRVLDPTGQLLSAHLFREACTDLAGQFQYQPGRMYTKDLSLVCEDKRRVVLVDNSPYRLLATPVNGLLIKEWVSDEGDLELLRLSAFLAKVKDADDVTHLLHGWAPNA